MRENVLVPVDDSAHAKRALTVAATIFDDPTLIIFHAVDPFDATAVTEDAVWGRECMENRNKEATELLEEYQALAAEHGVTAETSLAYGAPSRAILGAIDDFEIDHVVIGSRGQTGFGRVRLGSVAESVAKYAPVSVTIVRPDR